MGGLFVTADKLVESCSVRNHCEELSTMTTSHVIRKIQNPPSYDKYILSKAHEKLIIEIKFKREIALGLIAFFTLPITITNEILRNNISPAKIIYIYNGQSDININTKPHKIIELSKNISKHPIELIMKNDPHSVKYFSKMQYLTIYVKSNHDDAKHTYLNGVSGIILPTQEILSKFDPDIKYDMTRYDESIVNQLVQLGYGTRQDIIKASSLAADYLDADCVREALVQLRQTKRMCAALKFAAEAHNDPNNKWNCSKCTFQNEGNQFRCSMCATSIFIKSKPINDAQIEDSKRDDICDTDTNSWKCPICTLQNTDTELYCITCSAPNPTLPQPANTQSPSHQLVSQLLSSHGPSQCMYDVGKCPCLKNVANFLKSYHAMESQLTTMNIIAHICNLSAYNTKIKLLCKIFENVLQFQNCDRYRNLNLSRIRQKLNNCEFCMQLLKIAGFSVSDNGKRLVFNVSDLSSLENIYQKLSLILNDKTVECCPNQEALTLFNELFINYSEVDLLNDFNHLLYTHENDIEIIKHILVKDCCDTSSCHVVRRHYRDRTNEKCLNMYLSNDINDIVCSQFADAIHSHYFHSYNIRSEIENDSKTYDYQISRSNSTQIDQKSDVVKENQSDLFKCISDLTQTGDRFMEAYSKRLAAVAKHKLHHNKFSAALYSYGYRYFYWKYYKENIDLWDKGTFRYRSKYSREPANIHPNGNYFYLQYWYIPKKYHTLKEEITQNEYCKIPLATFNHTFNKAKVKIQTVFAKTIICRTDTREHDYKIFEGSPVRIEHLLSMMLYCNFTILQQKCSETYRKINQYETDASLKQRHSNYANWGRLLRELVDAYGWYTDGSEARMHLYHGLNTTYEFTSLHAIIKGPFSATRDIQVAKQFCDNKGMVITMVYDVYMWIPRSNCQPKMDCQWLSDFAYEKEVFFIGGYSGFDIYSILMPNGVEYNRYCRAISEINISIQSSGLQQAICSIEDLVDENLHNKDKIINNQMICRLLANEMHKYYPKEKQFHEWVKLPKFIDKLFHVNCTNIPRIKMLPGFDKDSILQMLFKQYFLQPNGLVKLDRLVTIFPRLHKIFLTLNCNVTATFDEINLWILQFLESYRKGQLKRVEIELPYYEDYLCQAKKLEKEYSGNFFDKYWFNDVSTKKDLIVLQFASWTDDFMRQSMEKDLLKKFFQKQ
eukprot:455519_1